MEKSGLAFALGKDRIRIFQLEDGKLLLDNQSEPKAFFAERVQKIPILLQGEWRSKNKGFLKLDPHSITRRNSVQNKLKVT